MISANAVTRSRSDDSVDAIVVSFYLYIYICIYIDIVVLSHVSSLSGYLFISNKSHVSGINSLQDMRDVYKGRPPSGCWMTMGMMI